MEEKKKRITKEGLKRAVKVIKYIAPYKYFFFLGLVLIVLGNGLTMLIPGVAGEMVNTAIDDGRYGFSLQTLAFMLFGLVISQALISFVQTIALAFVSEKGMADVRQDLYNKLITQEVHFFESNRVGELTSRITTDVEQLRGTFSMILPQFLRQIFTLIIGIAILAYLTPQLSLIMLMTFPVVVVATAFFSRYIRRLSRKRQETLAETNTVVEETLTNFSTVKSFTNEYFEANRYGKLVQKVVKISLRFAQVRGLFFGFVISLLFGTMLFILWRGAIMVEAGTMEAGYLFSFVLYTAFIGGSIAGLGNSYSSIASALGATDRVLDILERENEVEVKDNFQHNRIKIIGDISFENVRFSYPSRKELEVLKSININIKAGGKVALVGQSGSGKSTIAQLLMKFYHIDSGSIKIDGRDIDDYDLSELRRCIGIVPQDVMMFGGTIKENIQYGNPNASEEELIDALKQANAYDFVFSFPDDLNTVIGERGIKLSGGQKQRIAIARAIIKDPKILILDEATSSLDAESEKIVQDALDRLMTNRTSIVIAHRLATIKAVDNIYVLKDGQIIESGSHDDLVEIENGVYQNLAQLQFDHSY